MKETMVALVLMCNGCSALQNLSIPDILRSIEDLRTECHGLVSRLGSHGLVGVTAEECDKSALESFESVSVARDKLGVLLDRLRVQLEKAIETRGIP